jgi:hypothetical protein
MMRLVNHDEADMFAVCGDRVRQLADHDKPDPVREQRGGTFRRDTWFAQEPLERPPCLEMEAATMRDPEDNAVIPGVGCKPFKADLERDLGLSPTGRYNEPGLVIRPLAESPKRRAYGILLPRPVSDLARTALLGRRLGHSNCGEPTDYSAGHTGGL